MKLITKIGLSMAAATTLFLSGCNSQPDQAKADNTANATTNKKADTTVSATTNKKVVELSNQAIKSRVGIGYGSVSLNDDKSTGTPGAKYIKDYAGSGKVLKRAFQDAPPMIPHDTEGMLPITKDNNACLGCHLPDVAKSVNATPVPVSHLTNFRPKSYAIKGANTSSEKLAHISIKKTNKLYKGRFNCSQCHAPQAQNVKLITENNFQADFTSKDGAFKSSWDDTKFMEGIDTTK
jgi:cytochrome c-type protein NapB